MIAKVIICIMLLNNFSSLNSKSCKEYPKIEHRFHLLRHCQRSNKSIIAFSNVDSLTECSDLARTNRALAFNFSPGDRRKINLFQKGNESLRGSDEFFNCEVLDCPEYRGFPSLVNDTRFDYYSLYTRPPPIEDEATCVPSVGMFMFFKERSNYSVAYNVCASMRGNLAHIASEVRNVELAKFLRSATNSSVKERAAFVGLNEAMLDKFFTSNDEPLGCFDFRAWAPGHPPEIRKPGCVGITPESSWKVFNCSRRMMFFCELLTSGPNPYVNNINQKCSAKRPNNRFIPKKALKVMR